jgi:hypothetical protein
MQHLFILTLTRLLVKEITNHNTHNGNFDHLKKAISAASSTTTTPTTTTTI